MICDDLKVLQTHEVSLLSMMKKTFSAAEIRALLDEHCHNNAQIQELWEHAQSDEANLRFQARLSIL